MTAAATENQVPNTVKTEDPDADAKPELPAPDTAEVKTEVKTEEKSEVKTEEKSEGKTEAKPDIKTEVINVTNGAKAVTTEEKKEEVKVEPVEIDEGLRSKIMRQLEYYFGDKNLPTDRFMLREISLDLGWIPLSTMLNFKRLSAICNDKQKIAGAVHFGSSTLLEINADCNKLRRRADKPLPKLDENTKAAASARTAYVKGFPLNEFNIDQAEEFFSQFGKTAYIKLRKDAEGKFKGSVFVEFETLETCDKFCALPELKYKEEALQHQTRNSYFQGKNQKAREDKNKRRDEQLGVKEEDVVPENVEYEAGRVLKIEGLEGVETSREDMKDVFEGQGVTWVTFNKGDKTAHIRFDKSAGEALTAVLKEDKFTLSGKELKPVVIEGDEEKKYWTDAAAEKAAFYRSNKKRKAENNRGRRGGGGGFRGKRRRT